MTKMTNAVALSYVLSTYADSLPQDVTEKLSKMLEQVEKKNHAEKKPTATQTANEGFKQDILTYMVKGNSYTVTDLMKGVPSLADLSNQRVSALIRQMIDAGQVRREEVKRKAYFTLA